MAKKKEKQKSKPEPKVGRLLMKEGGLYQSNDVLMEGDRPSKSSKKKGGKRG